jgi:hypothetical protein
VVPRVAQTVTRNGEAVDDPTLKTHTKPIKVDVNLVLVPVSIVDPADRQVTGLDKENFEVFEGKQRQVWEESPFNHLRRWGQPQPLHAERDQELGKRIGCADLRHWHL